MIAKTTRILSILSIFLFSFFCKSLAVVRYVNLNNPTPGAGTSWATAFNDLQAALAISGIFDHIWVAQGTYKPSLPAGRSATFRLPGGANLYGGFNGTETAETQRNPTLYPTILSGDIGVIGDRTDNCYHVVTIQNGTSNSDLYGFTVRDGQADAGYPASSIAAPDNTGGGLLVLAHPGEISYTELYNCIFTGNFAVYGGAIGGFGDGGQQTNTNIYQCLFDGNQAIYGGASASIASNGDWAPFTFHSCIFNNNTVSGANASVVYQSMDNAASNSWTDLEGCLFYNEAVPLFTSLTTGSNYRFDLIDCILWKSGSPYAGGYANGNSPVTIGTCDINGSLPSGSNIDADPMFANAAGGDFHVPPCSPVVDAGFPWASPSENDFGGQSRYQGTNMDIGPYEQVKGTVAAAPTATNPPAYCQNVVASQLTATGSNLLWYTVSSGGTGDPVAPTPSTVSTGSTTYYVSQTPASSCESPRAPVTVTVNAGAVAPTVGASTPICQNSVASPLAATGTGLLWYTVSAGGVGVSTAPTPSTVSAGSTTYYVTQTVSGCESTRAPVTVTISSAPPAPGVSNPTAYCQNGPSSQLNAVGNALVWYTAAAGGVGVSTAPTPSTASVGSTTYYVTQTMSGCESPRAPVTVTINAGAAAPVATSPQPYCQNSVATALTATGSGLLWYTVAAGGVGVSTAPTPSTASAGSTTYYVTQTVSGCESPRAPITVTINAGAVAPAASSPSYCVGDVAPALTATAATGASLMWYTVASGGTGVSAAPVPSTNVAGMVSYFVSQVPATGCESQRKEVDVTVKAAPTVQFSWSNACEGKATTITAAASNGAQYTWDFGSGATVTGSGAGPYQVQWAAGNSNLVTLKETSGGCQGQIQHLVTVNPGPKVGIAPLTSPLCAGSTVSLEAYGASSYQWSPATGLSNAGIADPLVRLQNNIQYYSYGNGRQRVYCYCAGHAGHRPGLSSLFRTRCFYSQWRRKERCFSGEDGGRSKGVQPDRV
ncbi:hypothetical protein ACQ86N_34065 [Puia sp. P3]|uniref:Ig-like domain-containing protein n=1 Tax=Puia sp. P3 TaxID=3423952 RepID=UPI003D6739F4